MGIYDPNLLLSKSDREILKLLGQLVLAADQNCSRSNLKSGDVPLSPSEAENLLGLLEQFLNSKLFVEGAYFSEGIANGNAWSDNRLKDIYLAWRSRLGRSRVASSFTWHEFVLRAGFNNNKDAWMWPSQIRRAPLRPMPLEHFLRMEARLLKAADVHPRVADLVIRFVMQSIPMLEEMRATKYPIVLGSVRGNVSSMISDLAQRVHGNEKEPMTRHRLIALCTIVMDTSALFSTRDWTTTGVLSTMAASLPDALGFDDESA
jgi:hypothetical protein